MRINALSTNKPKPIAPCRVTLSEPDALETRERSCDSHDNGTRGTGANAPAQVAASQDAATRRKTVAIIGAGPAGLVAAKSMLEAGLAPTVFDRARTVGGMWAAQSGRGWASLRTNVSKYACGFSDFPWPADASMFPTQREVDAYLSRYAQFFLHDGATLSLGHKVEHVACDAAGMWHVRMSPADPAVSPRIAQAPECAVSIFDHLVVASGFFATPHIPHICGIDTFAGTVLHSDAYQGAEAFAGRRVAVVGGSFSAVALAADLAPKADAVFHVAPRPFWVIPRFIPEDAAVPGTALVPLDSVFYKRFMPGPQAERLAQDGEDASGTHAWFRATTGTYAQHLPPPLQPQDTDPVMVAICDTYTPWLASAKIALQPGRLTEVEGSTLKMSQGETLRDVDTLVLCTGYRPDVSYLDEPVQRALQWDASDTFMPLVADHSVFHPEFPTLACVGMYRSPFFGVMEAQARWAAAVFAGHVPAPTADESAAGMAREQGIKHVHVRPQFPHRDYVGHMDDIYGRMQQAPGQTLPGTVVIPAHYRPQNPEALATARDVETTLTRLNQGAAAAAGVFYGLGGLWTFERTITHRKQGMPQATVKGTATFAPGVNDNMWEYTESGQLLTQSDRVHASQQYLYKLDPATHILSVDFVRGANAGNEFHALAFAAPQPGALSNTTLFAAEGTHLCGQDKYEAAYKFDFIGSGLASFEIDYNVTGPAKDYTSRTQFTRPKL